MKLFFAITTIAICSMAFSNGMSNKSVNKDESLFVHSVYIWLKEDVTNQERSHFLDLLQGLEQIKSVEALEIGLPAGTPRDIVDNSYDIALFVYFEDREAHDLYQKDKIHTDAKLIFEDWIEEIKIYDAICGKE